MKKQDTYTQNNNPNSQLSFPLIEVETADSFWNSGIGNNAKGSILYDFEIHPRQSSSIFDSSISGIFEESDIDIETSSFVSEISNLGYSISNISTSPNSGNAKKNRKRKRKGKGKSSEEDFPFTSPDHFFDYFQSYQEPSMSPVLVRRWNKKSLPLRKEVICAYRAEDARLNPFCVDKTEQRLREEEEMRREKVSEFGVAHEIDATNPIYDDQDKEFGLDQNQNLLPQNANINDQNNNNTEIAEKEVIEIQSIDEPIFNHKKVSNVLILSLIVRFLFYIGHILGLC